MSDFSIHVEGLTSGEVMQAMRRMMLRPYLILWAAVYAVVLAVCLWRRHADFFLLAGPAIILILLALAYEFSGRKNYRPMEYDKAVLDYTFTPEGYTLTVGDTSKTFRWETARLKRTRSNFLLYSDPRNSSILPRRCLTTQQQSLLRTWAARS